MREARGHCSNKCRVSNKHRVSIKHWDFEARVLIMPEAFIRRFTVARDEHTLQI